MRADHYSDLDSVKIKNNQQKIGPQYHFQDLLLSYLVKNFDLRLHFSMCYIQYIHFICKYYIFVKRQKQTIQQIFPRFKHKFPNTEKKHALNFLELYYINDRFLTMEVLLPGTRKPYGSSQKCKLKQFPLRNNYCMSAPLFSIIRSETATCDSLLA